MELKEESPAEEMAVALAPPAASLAVEKVAVTSEMEVEAVEAGDENVAGVCAAGACAAGAYAADACAASACVASACVASAHDLDRTLAGQLSRNC